MGEAAVGVIAVGALHLGFQVKLGSSSISAFRAVIVRAVLSSEMPLTRTPAILKLLDGLVLILRSILFGLGFA